MEDEAWHEVQNSRPRQGRGKVEAKVLRQRQFDGGRGVARGRELEVDARTRQGGGRSVEQGKSVEAETV